MHTVGDGATNSLWRVAASLLFAVLALSSCSPGEVVQVEWDPVTPSVAPPSTAVPEPTTPLVPTVEPAVALQPTPVLVPTAEPSAEPVPTEEVAPTVEPTVAPEPSAAPEATAVPAPVATQPPAPTSQPAGNDSQAVRAANGGEVYTLNCARCHAESGLGTAQYSGLIGVGSKYSTAGMIAELTTGHRVTFGFADKLSADEIASVVAYVKATFQ